MSPFEDKHTSVDQYRTTIRAFLDNRLTAPEFRTQFVKRFLGEPATMERGLFIILQALLEAVESYRQDWPPPENLLSVLISEDELRREAQIALDALDQLAGT